MGKQSRRKREGRKPRPTEATAKVEATDHAREFRRALAKEHLNEMATVEADCVACGRRAIRGALSAWIPNDEVARRIGVPEGKYRAYFCRTCDACAEKVAAGDPWTVAFLEASAVARHRGMDFVVIGPDGLPMIGDGPTPPVAFTI